MAIDLDRLSQQELDALILAAEEQKKRLKREKITDVRRRILELAKNEGYTIEELFSDVKAGKRSATTAAAGRTVAAKYRNPADPAQTWSGRGKRPRWYQAALDAGRTDAELQA
jgi:DNA-binding protein H-NS